MNSNTLTLALSLALLTIGFSQQKPNVLFIAVDDLNDYISPLDNHPGIVTPNFERLAKRSVTFANAHCAAPACHPSRVAVMTGVHPTTSGIYNNLFGAHGPRWRHESPVLENATVLSQHFRNHGYHAAGGGKLFHTLQWTPGDSQNDPDAWDVYRGDPLDPISADWPRPASTQVDQNEGFVGKRPLNNHYFGAAVIEEPDETHGDQLVVDWALEQLKAKQDKPLFLAVGLFRPHIPFEVSQKWFDLYPLDEVKLPEHRADDLDDCRAPMRESWHKWVEDNDQWKHLMQGYLASISYVDHQLGRLLDGLDASPLKENTIVVLWTDHGFHIGEKKNWEKFALWQQTTRVPLFIHVPGVSKDGAKTMQPTTLTDLYPTLCELIGLPIPEQCDGKSLVPQLRDPSVIDDRLSLTSQQWGGDGSPSHGVSDAKFRYIKYATGYEELYDLEKDPHEFTNLAEIENPDYRVIMDRLAKAIPADVPVQVAIPTDSPYHRARGGRQGKKSEIANLALRIEAEVTPNPAAPNGVIVSHGGGNNGYAVFVQNGELQFGVRRDKKLIVAKSAKPVPTDSFKVVAELKATGEMELSLNDEVVGKADAGGLFPANPVEGQLFRSDDRTPVGKYATPFNYRGKLGGLKITKTKPES